jgi:hypothetical protein
MKAISLFVLALSFCAGVTAQAVSISTEPAPVEYYRMPDDPLPPEYSTYTADLDIPTGELIQTGMNESDLIEDYLFLEGYQRVNKNADVMINATIGEFFVWNEIRNTNRNKTKDSKGNEVIKYTYSLEVKYSLPLYVKVRDNKSKTWIDEHIFTMSDTRTWTSPTYKSLDELDSYWRIQRKSKLADLQKDITKEGMNKLSDLLNDRLGFQRINDKARFGMISKKNHPDYESFKKNVEIIQSAFELMDADGSLDAVRIKAEPALAFYEGKAEQYSTGNKDQKKLKHLCLYNQALAYFWLEDFEKAETLAKSIQKFDTKNKDVRRLLDDIEYTRASLHHAGRSSRHQVTVGNKS